ncbi:hypothetical protein A9995_08600 [Erythrobacter sp. QSSC1-22B]|uniref:DUF2490 domain-containing protein n=1 Tax=Erythrobacter sp. QSSC1-22B TaxID=1860125 RepID=UPI000804D167|nr:DUF2490 domain-containing protein [Erythrobacter sp. QSSC1-22B]OBX19180.1 hypothetical protein A9995_08600 [Erythrobacter sp. QSSC1-22B]
MNLTHFRAWTFAGLYALVVAAPAHAADEAFEFWLNPSISVDLDSDTGLELETAQRLRSEADGRVDTYFARLWLTQALADNVTLGGAIERRINDGASNETRLMQQLSTKHGLLRTRLRLEERFVDGTGRMGLRLQPRLGVAVPLDTEGRWSFYTNAELFFTLKSTSVGGDDGLTGLRTQVGTSYAASDNLSLSLTYLRQQDFKDAGSDQIGHVPLVGIEFSF